MSFTPLFDAGLVVTLHALIALSALGLGAVQLILPKGGRRHQIIGYIWVGCMGIVALSSFLIHDIQSWGRWSAIHLLSLFTLVMLGVGIRHARGKAIRAHQRTMTFLFIGALIGAGAFTLLPGRVMHTVLFGQ